MQTRQNASCWKLFINTLSSFNVSTLKLLGIALLMMNHKAQAADIHTFKFFSRHDNVAARVMENPCIQAYPGDHLLVRPDSLNKYSIGQAFEKTYFDQDDLAKQLADKRFVGDVFCDGKLQTLKEKRMQPLQGKSFFNSDYTVDLSDPIFIEIKLSTTDKNKNI